MDMTDHKDFLISEVLNLEPNRTFSSSVEGKLKVLRNENIVKPIIFVGAGTCGLGAGADKTLLAIKEYISVNKIDVDIIETGCIGLCSSEPLMDIQIPGKNRISFEKVTHDLVVPILSTVLWHNIIPEKNRKKTGRT